MKRRSSVIIVASGVASVAALMIAGGQFHERPVGLHSSLPDAGDTGETTVVVRSLTPATIARGDLSGPAPTSPPSADRTTVAAPLPTSTTADDVDVPSVATSPGTSDTVGVADMQTIAPPTNEYVLEIPAIDLHEQVVAGDQDEIDQGHVTAVDWSAYGFPTSCRPGDGCTVWLAGHRSTHHAVFARLPEITAGSLIEIHLDGEDYAYTVTDVVTVPGTSPPSVIHGDLVLQTSAPGGERILIYAAAMTAS